MNKRIRIKDIAEKAGVSAGTVDRVLHGRGNVSTKAKEKVEAVLEEIGYERNIIASTLAYNRTFRVATLMPDVASDSYWEKPNRGIQQAMKKAVHYGVVLEPHYFDLFDAKSFVEKAKTILEEKPDAILFSPLFLQESILLLKACEEKSIVAVMVNTDIADASSLSYIGQDSYQSGVLAGRLLHFGMDEGSEALLLNLEVGSYNAQHLIDKERGFRDYFSQFPEQSFNILKKEFEAFEDQGKLKSFLEDILSKHPKLEGIFVTNSRAWLAVECLPEAVVQKMKIVGFDLIEENIRHLKNNNIDFLLNQNPVQQGYLGIMTLVNYLVVKENVEKQQFLPLDIVVTENVNYYLKRQEEFQNVI